MNSRRADGAALASAAGLLAPRPAEERPAGRWSFPRIMRLYIARCSGTARNTIVYVPMKLVSSWLAAA